MTDAEVRLEDGPGHAAVTVRRAGALALLQRPGEVQVLQDGFEAIDPARWTAAGAPAVVADPHREGSRSLRLPAGGASLTAGSTSPSTRGGWTCSTTTAGGASPASSGSSTCCSAARRGTSRSG